MQNAMKLEQTSPELEVEKDQKTLRVLLECSFYDFVVKAFEVRHNGQALIQNWHIEYLCSILQAETERIIRGEPKQKDIIINVPPRSLKSFTIGICWPAWSWIHKPSFKFLGSSYSGKLSLAHNYACRQLIESDWYQENWGDKVILTTDQNTKGNFENTEGGFRFSTSTGGSVMGIGGDVIFEDDPQDTNRAFSEIERENCINYSTQTLSTRFNDSMVGLHIIIMQRLHEGDLTGYYLKNEPESFRHISLPVSSQGGKILPAALEKNYEDDLLFPAKFPASEIKKKSKRLGSIAFAGQFLQSPSPIEGALIKKSFWQYYNVMPQHFDDVLDSWDMAFKDLETSDHVVGTVLARKGSNIYILHMTRAQMNFSKSKLSVLQHRTRFKHLRLSKSLIEDKANGPGIISELENVITGINAYNPGSNNKLERVHMVHHMFEAGNIYLPVKDIATFDTEEMVDEFARFRGLETDIDDIVDSVTQALIYFSNNKRDWDEIEEMNRSAPRSVAAKGW